MGRPADVMKSKRILGAAALTIIAVISQSNQRAFAETNRLSMFEKQPANGGLALLKLPEPEVPVVMLPPKPIEYTVAKGDNLTKIAEANNTTWIRLWQKNSGLVDPDAIKPGDKLIIPDAGEKLADRPLPANVTPAAQSLVQSNVQRSASISTFQRTRPAAPRGTSAGNTYTFGYCTWYVKNRRPDIPNNLGNANTWLTRAAAQGLATGSAPAVGAIGAQGNHVVYVEAVNGDGTVTVSEMNYKGWNITSSRRAPASSFRYIY